MAKAIGLSDEVHAYVVEHGTPPDPVLSRLIERTESSMGQIARMQIPPEQGAFMTWMTQLLGARNAIEIGTFTGYSAICIARGLAENGHLLCLDFSEEWTNIARAAWREAKLEDRIELRLGAAAETLSAVPEDAEFDLAFIDADRENYETYLDLLHPRLRVGGVIIVDNVLLRGRVADQTVRDERVQVVRDFNHARLTDARWDRVMIPISDGLTLLRKR